MLEIIGYLIGMIIVLVLIILVIFFLQDHALYRVSVKKKHKISDISEEEIEYKWYHWSKKKNLQPGEDIPSEERSDIESAHDGYAFEIKIIRKICFRFRKK